MNTHGFLLISRAGTWLRQLLSNVFIDSLLCVGRQGSFILITAQLLYRRNLRRIYSNEELLQSHPVFITPLEMVRRRKLFERFGRPFNWPWNPQIFRLHTGKWSLKMSWIRFAHCCVLQQIRHPMNGFSISHVARVLASLSRPGWRKEGKHTYDVLSGLVNTIPWLMRLSL